MSQRGRRRWTDEDAAYAAAQWASGIKQRDIAKVFGLATNSVISVKIDQFIRKYTDLPKDGRVLSQYCWRLGIRCQDLVKPALARFVEARNQRVLGASQ